ncbi:hypothetical protein ABH923_002760 [Leifsonia sp. EB41]
MNKKLIALAALLPCLALAGCVSPAAPARDRSFTTVAPAATPTADPTMPIADGIVDTVWVEVFGGTTFTAKTGCKCTLPGTAAELFPASTPVLFLKVTLTGEWKPSQGNQTTQDVTGTTLKGTQFDGRPEPAVLDTADGPAAAKAAGLPWLPGGLFHGKTDWTIQNNKGRSFAAAFYLPAGVDRLVLTVDVPSEGQATHLFVTLPEAAVRASTASGE